MLAQPGQACAPLQLFLALSQLPPGILPAPFSSPHISARSLPPCRGLTSCSSWKGVEALEKCACGVQEREAGVGKASEHLQGCLPCWNHLFSHSLLGCARLWEHPLHHGWCSEALQPCRVCLVPLALSPSDGYSGQTHIRQSSSPPKSLKSASGAVSCSLQRANPSESRAEGM